MKINKSVRLATNMNHKHIVSLLRISVFIVAFFCISEVGAQNSKFTVVIDAGHGGHDPGAMGKISREKDINLAVSLQLGELIATNYNDVKVVFTRTTDKYLTLQERADIVNNNHADLFICIHTNSAQSTSAYGTESFTLGLAKSKGNLDVAMRENSVMLLEDDYKSKYKGFDPTSVDSYIMFEFMQDKYIDRSISIASDIQSHFKNYANRSDRGVRQAGFWVLYRSACPSVLIELGFISNAAEEKFLASSGGQKQLAESIYKAFVSFKHENDKKSGKSTNKTYIETESIKIDDVGRNDKRSDGVSAPLKSVVANTKDAVVPVSEIVKPPLDTQPTTSKSEKKNAEKTLKEDKKETVKKLNSKNIEVPAEKQVKDTDIIAESLSKDKAHVIKPTETPSKQKAADEIDESISKSPKTETKTISKVAETVVEDSPATKVASAVSKPKSISADKEKYVDMNAYESATEKPVYKLQLFASSKKLKSNAAEFRGIRNTDFFIENGMYKYTIGSDTKYEVVSKLRKEMLALFPDAFVIAFLGKNKIKINDAIKLTNKNK